MKKRNRDGHANHERWLVSYADFITLLFAFFVVMFATAQQDKSKAKIVAQAVRDAMEHGELSNVWTNFSKPKRQSDRKADSPLPPAGPYPAMAAEKQFPPPSAPSATRADLAKSMEALHQGLADEVKAGKITLDLNQRGLVVGLREAAFFASGDDAVSAASGPIMDKIVPVIGPLANPLRLEGYTDSVPIHNSRFRNNWELSTARSIALLELLEQRYQFPRARMSVAGYAENAPADTNQTEEGRAHNRRVDMVILSAESLAGEPGAAALLAQPASAGGASSPRKGLPGPSSVVPVGLPAPAKAAPKK